MTHSPRIALFFTPSRVGGGVGRSLVTTARALAERGHAVDLVLSRGVGPYVREVPESVNLVVLKATRQSRRRRTDAPPDLATRLIDLWMDRTFRYLPDLVRYLEECRPTVLFAAKTYPNLAALRARRLADVPTRVIVSERTTLSSERRDRMRSLQLQWQCIPAIVRRTYPAAHAIVAVSNGVADDLASTTGLPRATIATLYNPVITEELATLARVDPGHRWLRDGGPPVFVAAGRLERQKDFPTLLRAFARVRAIREVKLVILGEGRDRRALEALVRRLGIASDVDLAGHVANPYAFMARAAAFVLSSSFEGLPGVLIQALGTGCPVVSTNCPHGPAEVLAGGEIGRLVPVGDDRAMADAMAATLDAPREPERLRAAAARFSVDRAIEHFLAIAELDGSEPRLGAAVPDRARC
jgi:glycosyltransferase involved in cell wall biosynthesis